jgi:hypothetical protein
MCSIEVVIVDSDKNVLMFPAGILYHTLHQNIFFIWLNDVVTYKQFNN